MLYKIKMFKIRSIAFYLPQYHASPENDKAWGKGFTEWTNVKKAIPLFKGHYQPHVPHESVGYYDLNDPAVMVRQVAMAKEYGISGFCFYHYWFNGKKLLETPVNNFLKLANKIDFPFCLCWANENWTRRWDGLDNEIIIEQSHSKEDDLAFILDKIPFFNDERYIKIDNKPILLVYRTELLPNAKKTADIWRTAMREHGIGEIYLIRVESFLSNFNPIDINFDASVEFAPDRWNNGTQLFPESNGTNNPPYMSDYLDTVLKTLTKKMPNYKLYRSAFPNWDNTARRGFAGSGFLNNDPKVFELYLQQIVNYTLKNMNIAEQFIFINAWNEWGEGCHLEPDKKNEFKYLEICKKIFQNGESDNSDEILLYLYSIQNQMKTDLAIVKNELNRITNSLPFKFKSFFLKPIFWILHFFKSHIK